MGVWGSVSGVAMLIAPLLGGVLVDHLGWQSIFLVNLPVGVIGLILVAIFVPSLPGEKQRFDWIGVAISGLGLLTLVFAIQEGAAHNWGQVLGPITIWEMIIVAVVLLGLFVWWEAVGATAPLVPMRLFRHRDFAVASVAIVCVGFVVAAMPLPLLYFFQLGRGYSAVDSAWFMMPSAVVSGVLAPVIGAKLIHRLGARVLAPIGLILWAVGLCWMSQLSTPDSSLLPSMLLASVVVGLGNACVWSPLSVVATRDLPPHEAGAGASVYNTTRQIGSVLGAACVSTLMSARIAANLALPPAPDERFADQAPTSFAGIDLAQLAGVMSHNPELASWFQGHFTAAMGQSMWLPLAIALVGAAVAWGVTSRRKAAGVSDICVGNSSEDHPSLTPTAGPTRTVDS
jgi:MFS family permease